MSNKITFSHEVRHWQTDELIKTHNMTVHENTLGELIEDFEMFLRGCGFVLPAGTRLDIVEDKPITTDDPYVASSLEEFDHVWPTDNTQHTTEYFDTERNR